MWRKAPAGARGVWHKTAAPQQAASRSSDGLFGVESVESVEGFGAVDD